MTKIIRTLHDGWTVAGGRYGPVPATVPGCVHTDLLAAGLIPDPYLDDNEVRLDWIGRTEWRYQTSFAAQVAAGDRADLVFAGLDTVATVELNGTELGHTANMHRSYRFPVEHLLRPGGNTLRVRFDPVLAYAERLRERLGERPGSYPLPYNFVRKMACNFGWDWGPTLTTAGIWRTVGLHLWRQARLAEVRPLVTVTAGTGRVQVHVELERATDAPVTVAATVAGRRVSTVAGTGATGVVLTVEVPEPALWWPRGYGAQARYELAVTLSDEDGSVLDTWQRNIGFRSVRLDTADDPHGSAFTLLVNDAPVLVRGVNWIPDDCFPSRVDRSRYASRLAQAADAGVNYLRIWGGGIYESDDFYDIADEMGLLVGQDFLFACASYPEEEPLRGEVVAEARENVVRLASHPSLVMWTGNNENLWGYADWGWPEQLAGRSWGGGYYFETLPAIVAGLDPTRPYWPGSPYSGDPSRHPNDPRYGTTHIWDVWNTEDYTHYRDYTPRFAAEFGYQAPPAYPTLRRAVHDEPLTPDSPGLRHHQKAEDGNAKLRRGLAAHLPKPRDFDDWHYLTQLNQARAVRLGVEHLRALWPICSGTIVWQLNDCWPVISWSAIDGDGRRKPMWYALRHAYADRLLTIQPHDGGLHLVALNDTGAPWPATVSVSRTALTGEVRAEEIVRLAVPPRGTAGAPLPPSLAVPADPTGELLRARCATGQAHWFFAEDRDIPYPKADYTAAVEPYPGGVRVTVSARTVLRDLTLYPDRLDPLATVDEALVTLLPGESTTFTVHSNTVLDAAALTTPPVLRCVNDIVP